MFNSKKIVAAAGVLGSFALIGLGAVQAVGAENAGTCAEDSKGNLRCVQQNEYRLTEKDGKVRVDNKTSQTCSGKGELSCENTLVVGEKS
ncbi:MULTISPECIES: hypothetical protein [unclassified Streptomyces]|jgi:hypothetical protein|uniref:hypothetical protein n=1 Tax=unclassified Streptomyces TaxID=2593676 RepID=UPI003701E47A